MSPKSKAILGNTALVMWFVAGISFSIWLINWIPAQFGDKAGMLLPAYIVVLVAGLVAGRLAIESAINRRIVSDDTTFIVGWERAIATSTTFVVIVASAAAGVGPNLNIEVQKNMPSSGDFGAFVAEDKNTTDSATLDVSLVATA